MISYGKIEKTLKLLKSDPTKAGMCLGRGLEDSVRSGFNRWVCRRLLGKTWLGFQASSLDIPQVQCIRQFQGLKGHTVFHCISNFTSLHILIYIYVYIYTCTYISLLQFWMVLGFKKTTDNELQVFFCIFSLHQSSPEICLSRWVSGRALGVCWGEFCGGLSGWLVRG